MTRKETRDDYDLVIFVECVCARAGSGIVVEGGTARRGAAQDTDVATPGRAEREGVDGLRDIFISLFDPQFFLMGYRWPQGFTPSPPEFLPLVFVAIGFSPPVRCRHFLSDCAYVRSRGFRDGTKHMGVFYPGSTPEVPLTGTLVSPV